MSSILDIAEKIKKLSRTVLNHCHFCDEVIEEFYEEIVMDNGEPIGMCCAHIADKEWAEQELEQQRLLSEL